MRRGCCKSANVPIRFAQPDDLAAIVDIYNASIPGRLATADTEPVSVDARRAWFAEFDAKCRPLWVFEQSDTVVGWLSYRSFYGRPAYHATVEVAVYSHPEHQRHGIGRALLAHALVMAPSLGIHTVLAFVFGHNHPSIALFESAGFARWGLLPNVADLDGQERDLAILGKRLA